MGIFDNIIDKLERIPEFIEKAIGEEVKSEKVEKDLVKKVKDQLSKGKRGDGTDIEPEYTEKTKSIKAKKGQRFDVVTLKDSGDWQESIYFKDYGGRGELDATDWKTEHLLEKYGYEILEVSDDAFDEILHEEIKIGLLQRIKNFLNGWL